MHRVECGANVTGLCDKMVPIDGEKLLEYLRKVNFTGKCNNTSFERVAARVRCSTLTFVSVRRRRRCLSLLECNTGGRKGRKRGRERERRTSGPDVASSFSKVSHSGPKKRTLEHRPIDRIPLNCILHPLFIARRHAIRFYRRHICVLYCSESSSVIYPFMANGHVPIPESCPLLSLSLSHSLRLIDHDRVIFPSPIIRGRMYVTVHRDCTLIYGRVCLTRHWSILIDILLLAESISYLRQMTRSLGEVLLSPNDLKPRCICIQKCCDCFNVVGSPRRVRRPRHCVHLSRSSRFSRARTVPTEAQTAGRALPN